MKRMIGMLVAALLCAGLLGGCTESTVINPENEDEEMPDLPQPGPDGLVWEQLWEDWAGLYQDTSAYPFAETVNANLDPKEGKASFFLLTNTDISEEEAADYAMDVIKGFGYLVSEQNSSYEEPSETSFGGYLSDYTIYVMVGPDETKSSVSTWILEDTIPAGEYREFKNSETEEEQSGETGEGQSGEAEEEQSGETEGKSSEAEEGQSEKAEEKQSGEAKEEKSSKAEEGQNGEPTEGQGSGAAEE